MYRIKEEFILPSEVRLMIEDWQEIDLNVAGGFPKAEVEAIRKTYRKYIGERLDGFKDRVFDTAVGSTNTDKMLSALLWLAMQSVEMDAETAARKFKTVARGHADGYVTLVLGIYEEVEDIEEKIECHSCHEMTVDGPFCEHCLESL